MKKGKKKEIIQAMKKNDILRKTIKERKNWKEKKFNQRRERG